VFPFPDGFHLQTQSLSLRILPSHAYFIEESSILPYITDINVDFEHFSSFFKETPTATEERVFLGRLKVIYTRIRLLLPARKYILLSKVKNVGFQIATDVFRSILCRNWKVPRAHIRKIAFSLVETTLGPEDIRLTAH